ncbi:sulfite exporter TauE/SafE family protein [Thioalkalivibrio sp. HK1]|uniref:sulfite exporter TauE/SafE family protein n=1 Tax=Thioalkalivibrio sp. HK1 TaxID=1469245 RepID=UPI00046EE2F7|nr:sulfite exporter TauE/SafE family protein [Thioalkalivibrio sp. HK1]
MTDQTIIWLVLGAISGSFINGLTGTGTALFALGFYLVALPPLQAVAIVALMSVLAGLQGLWVVRAAIRSNLPRLARFLLPALIGVPLGVGLLASIDAGTLRLAIATLLIVHGVYFGFRTTLPRFRARTPIIDGVIGFIGGLFGGAASVSGAIPSLWLSLRPWPKAKVRAVLQPFNVVVLAMTVGLLFFQGAYNERAIHALLITIPIGFVSAQAGIFVFRRIGDTTFRRLLIGLSLLMGIGIALQELF